MPFTLSHLDRSSFLSGEPLTFGSYHSAVEAIGGVLAAAKQGDTIQVAVEDEVLLRLRCEVAPRVLPMAGLVAGRDTSISETRERAIMVESMASNNGSPLQNYPCQQSYPQYNET